MSLLRSLRAGLRCAVALAWTGALIPLQMLALRLSSRWQVVVPQMYHRGLSRILGMAVVVHGDIVTDRQTLFVANHMSYLDIVVFASVLRASFVAKSEVAGWPLFGLLAKLNRTVFVAREARRSRTEKSEMERRLAAGDSLILFPEGTSNDGTHVLRFNSTFFAVAEQQVDGRAVTVQPVAIAYSGLNRLPLRRSDRPLFAWYGEMDMAGHLWRLAGLAESRVEVVFGEPVTIESFRSRKDLARHCESVVADNVGRVLSGRMPAPAAAFLDSNPVGANVPSSP